jgi:hypothetical protein
MVGRMLRNPACAVLLTGAILVGCGGGTAGSGSESSGRTPAATSAAPTPAPAPSPAPAPPPAPSASDFARVTVQIRGTDVERASARLGADYDKIFIYFTNRYTNTSSVRINAVEGYVALKNPFGEVVNRLGFSHLEPIQVGATFVDSDLGISFNRYECDFSSWKEWCRAYNANFSNFTLEAVVERVALSDGRVVSSR